MVTRDAAAGALGAALAVTALPTAALACAVSGLLATVPAFRALAWVS